MDRVTQRRKKGNRLIGQRYLLQTELVSNSAGILYQARDMRASDTATAPVLIHIFPNKALPQTPLRLMTERLQALSAQTDAAVLKVLDSGWLNSEAYFVLASPPSWSLSALPSMLGKTTRMHEQALRLNQRLTEQGLITGALPTALFLVSADGEVYLPSTALAPSLQTLTESPDLLLQAHLLPKRLPIRTLPWLGVGFISVVTAGGVGWYYQNSLMTSHGVLRASNAANNASLLEADTHLEPPIADTSPLTASLADKPAQPLAVEKIEASAKAVNIELATRSVSKPITPTSLTAKSTAVAVEVRDLARTPPRTLADPELGDMRGALAKRPSKAELSPKVQQFVANNLPLQDKITKTKPTRTEPIKPVTKPEKKAVTNPESQTEFVEETDPSVNLPAPRTELIKAAVDTQAPKAQFAASTIVPAAVAIVPAPRPLPVASTAPLLGVVNPVVTTPKPMAARVQLSEEERDSEALTANGMTGDELVKKAYQALQAGLLDEQANRGTVYFIRLLDRIDHGNPQITRLARETGYQLHQQVRIALIQGDSEQASQKLWRAGRIIKEFNLVHLNSAQELLEHKLVE